MIAVGRLGMAMLAFVLTARASASVWAIVPALILMLIGQRFIVNGLPSAR